MKFRLVCIQIIEGRLANQEKKLEKILYKMAQGK